MEAIGKIIEGYNPKPNLKKVECESSEFQNNDTEDHVYTSKEIIEKGIEYNTPPKNPTHCQFCNKALYQKGVVIPMANRVIAWLDYERCNCKKAKEYWRRHDWEEMKQQEIKRQEEENRKKRERINEILGNSKIGKRFINRTFENFKVDDENKRAYYNAKAYADNFSKFKEKGEGIYFSGNNGTGKTHLAVAIALQLMKKGIPVICMTSNKMLQEIKRTYDKNRNISEYQLLEAYKGVDLLVIDDIGQENCTDWAIAQLYDIINDRYERCLPTIVTTNLNEQDLIDSWSEKANYWTAKAIVSRLHEMTMGITMNGRDRRKEMY